MDTIIEALHAKADKRSHLSYRDFTQVALYHPTHGYYTQKKKRVGRNQETDFYTAESLGSVFKELILSAVTKILGKDNLKKYSFVELGAEKDYNLLAQSSHPFKEVLTFGCLDTIEIPPHSIVFSNELLDAQPFHRFVFFNNEWRELGVKINGTTLEETLLPENTINTAHIPTPAQEGYVIDYPKDSELLLEKIVTQNWSGLLLFFDYGHRNDPLLHDFPEGTARAYHKHQQHNDLLANPGNQDLTCHVWWDPLIDILKNQTFSHIQLDSQEKFFITQATQAIEELITHNPQNFDPRRQTLKELIHPGNMGMKFQTLWAIRGL